MRQGVIFVQVPYAFPDILHGEVAGQIYNRYYASGKMTDIFFDFL